MFTFRTRRRRWWLGAITTALVVSLAALLLRPMLEHGVRARIESEGIPADCGVYEIHTDDGIALKVGISANLRRRLVSHKMSRDSGLRVKVNGDRNHPDHVESKSSILAKHLYYDRSLTADYDLKTQAGRRPFLMERCHILIERVPTLAFARDIERSRERTGSFRYVGRVVIR